MDDTFVYCVPLPSSINEMVTPCDGGEFTIYINETLSYEKKIEAYNHALRHIANGDFDCDTTKDIHEVELKARW